MQAAYHGVPVVGLPLFAEQPDNMARAVEQGFGLSVDVNDALGLSQNLRRALQQVLGDPSFSGNATRISRLIKSTRWSPADQAASMFLNTGFDPQPLSLTHDLSGCLVAVLFSPLPLLSRTPPTQTYIHTVTLPVMSWLWHDALGSNVRTT